jgi:hypothetical protein
VFRVRVTTAMIISMMTSHRIIVTDGFLDVCFGWNRWKGSAPISGGEGDREAEDEAEKGDILPLM